MAVSALRRIRTLAGVLAKDWRRFDRSLRRSDNSYLQLCNRDETLEPSPDGVGFRCRWQFASDLHAPKIISSLGLRLMRRAFQDHPVRQRGKPGDESQHPYVTFLIGHRGGARLDHLLLTLESIAGQAGVAVECIVVEQDMEPSLAGVLPAWVRYLHTAPPAEGMKYCRSWAFNIAALHARGEILVLHDNDMMVPADYAASLVERVRAGYEVVNLKRFIFYLEEAHTRKFFDARATLMEFPPEAITQNLEGGGSIAITRESFFRIGGMDERFIGWGGEDNDFWERAQTLRVWPYAHLPIIHLWHAPQPGKQQAGQQTQVHYQRLSTLPVADRIRELKAQDSGCLAGPNGWDGHLGS